MSTQQHIIRVIIMNDRTKYSNNKKTPRYSQQFLGSGPIVFIRPFSRWETRGKPVWTNPKTRT